MNQEILQILSEECAEVIQSVSKCIRFDIDGYNPVTTKTNREHLEDEIGDVLCMIQILKDANIISWQRCETAKQSKAEKLRYWSSIDHSLLPK